MIQNNTPNSTKTTHRVCCGCSRETHKKWCFARDNIQTLLNAVRYLQEDGTEISNESKRKTQDTEMLERDVLQQGLASAINNDVLGVGTQGNGRSNQLPNPTLAGICLYGNTMAKPGSPDKPI